MGGNEVTAAEWRRDDRRSTHSGKKETESGTHHSDSGRLQEESQNAAGQSLVETGYVRSKENNVY